MSRNGKYRQLRPEPPLWAIEAGLPSPTSEESFLAYVQRLGIEEDLLEDLEPRTWEIANLRLAAHIERSMPQAWENYRESRRWTGY